MASKRTSALRDVSSSSSCFSVMAMDVDSDEDMEEDLLYQETIADMFGLVNAGDDVENASDVEDGWEISYSSSSESPESESDNDYDDVNIDFIPTNTPQASAPLPAEPPPKRKKPNKDAFPVGYDMKGWVEGDQVFCNGDLPPFNEAVGMTDDMPGDSNELCFFKLFVTDELLESMTGETNRYHTQYMEENKDKIPEKSRLLRFPVDGMSTDRMKAFIALTFLMGIVKKNDIKDYWSCDEVICTPFFAKIMSRDEYHNILTFFHLTNNVDYIRKGSPGYDPRAKLGFFYRHIISRFAAAYIPNQHLSVDEGSIPFKGRVAFKCFNPSKPNKYHLKTFKVVDSVTKYCSEFDLYVGAEINENATDFGQVHDLVMRLVKPYLGKSYIIYMDNWYSSPFLYFNLWQQQTGACGTSRYRRGYPTPLFKTKLKVPGDKVVVSGNNIHAIRIFDRKPVCLLSTVYDTNPVVTGKSHWQTKEPIMKPNLMHNYNKYMGGVDYNDQLLQYTAYDRRALKWWKKVAFRMLNICMTNAYILFSLWLDATTGKKITHVKYRQNVIKQLLSSIVLQDSQGVQDTSEFSRLTGKHFPELIPSERKQKVRRCQVCNPAERMMDRSAGNDARKRAGRESSFQCDSCKVALCVGLCFKLYHTRKNYIRKYIDMKNQ